MVINLNWPILLSDLGTALNAPRQTIDTWTTRGLNGRILKHSGGKLRYVTVGDAKQFFSRTEYEQVFENKLIGLLSGKYSVRRKWYPLYRDFKEVE